MSGLGIFLSWLVLALILLQRSVAKISATYIICKLFVGGATLA
jgi:hypothetical protein